MKERQRQKNSFVRSHEQRIVIQYNIPVTWTILSELARIIHERFCYNRGLAAATSLRRAGSSLAPSTYCSSTPRGLAAPHAVSQCDCAISRRTVMNNAG
ncbi:MAG TPA: hypothetical protein VGQ08_16425 [Nitrospiraceae bacterium]|nr:hypothetical protein [Nitrospiraceae bacterium]